MVQMEPGLKKERKNGSLLEEKHEKTQEAGNCIQKTGSRGAFRKQKASDQTKKKEECRKKAGSCRDRSSGDFAGSGRQSGSVKRKQDGVGRSCGRKCEGAAE